VDTHPVKSVATLLEEALTHPGRLVVITGGEPLMHDLGPLTEALKEAGFRTHMETSGVTTEITGTWDWVCFSPKKFKAPNEGILALTNELKVVVNHPSDIPWAQEWATKLPSQASLYLQPEWSKQDQMNPLIVDFVKANPSWQISVQTHKFLQIP
jgi:organic radical activating enzyme